MKHYNLLIIDKRNIIKHLIIVFFVISNLACKKWVETDPPISSIVTQQVFKDSVNAVGGIMGAYFKLSQELLPTNGQATIYLGLYGDELIPFRAFNPQIQLYRNLYFANSPALSWNQMYNALHQINSCIGGLQESDGISASAKDSFIGEMYFLRALVYFYLVNYYGDVPYITTIDWEQNTKKGRTPKSDIYQAMIADLVKAKDLLPTNYIGTERVRANKQVVTAFLARLYLYTKNWRAAAESASAIINMSSVYKLQSNLDEVFLRNSNEAIFQWYLNPSYYSNNTQEGLEFVPINNTQPPTYYLTSELLNSFEQGDQRKVKWINTTTYLGKSYSYPFKYKEGWATDNPGASPKEYNIVLRLAEQYLIRAEALIQEGKTAEGIADLNIIRRRATDLNAPLTNQLAQLPLTLTKEQALERVLQERRIELFAESGHRWFDLNRTEKVDELMVIISPLKNGGIAWQPFKKLLPIPAFELGRNPFLTQNPGYN